MSRNRFGRRQKKKLKDCIENLRLLVRGMKVRIDAQRENLHRAYDALGAVRTTLGVFTGLLPPEEHRYVGNGSPIIHFSPTPRPPRLLDVDTPPDPRQLATEVLRLLEFVVRGDIEEVDKLRRMVHFNIHVDHGGCETAGVRYVVSEEMIRAGGLEYLKWHMLQEVEHLFEPARAAEWLRALGLHDLANAKAPLPHVDNNTEGGL